MDKYFIVKGEAATGPYTIAELNLLASSGRISPRAAVEQDGTRIKGMAYQIPGIVFPPEDTHPTPVDIAMDSLTCKLCGRIYSASHHCPSCGDQTSVRQSVPEKPIPGNTVPDITASSGSKAGPLAAFILFGVITLWFYSQSDRCWGLYSQAFQQAMYLQYYTGTFPYDLIAPLHQKAVLYTTGTVLSGVVLLFWLWRCFGSTENLTEIVLKARRNLSTKMRQIR